MRHAGTRGDVFLGSPFKGHTERATVDDDRVPLCPRRVVTPDARRTRNANVRVLSTFAFSPAVPRPRGV